MRRAPALVVVALCLLAGASAQISLEVVTPISVAPVIVLPEQLCSNEVAANVTNFNVLVLNQTRMKVGPEKTCGTRSLGLVRLGDAQYCSDDQLTGHRRLTPTPADALLSNHARVLVQYTALTML